MGTDASQVYESYTVSGVTNGSDSLQSVTEDFWQWRLKEYPEFATITGEYHYDHLLQSYSLAAEDARREVVSTFSARLKAIDRSRLSCPDQVNYELLSTTMHDYFLDGYEWMRYVAVNPVNYLEGVTVNKIVTILKPADQTSASYRNILARIKAYPKQIEQQMHLMREAMRSTMINHKVSMTRVQANLEKLLAIPPNESDFYKIFAEEMDDVIGMTAADKTFICQEALQAIDVIYSTLRKLSDFVVNDYIPRTRLFYGVSGFPRGSEFYQACLRWHTTTNMSAQEVHDLGLSEVQRIQANMQQVLKEVNFTGSLSQFQESLRSNPAFYLDSEESLLQRYKLLIENVNSKLSMVFDSDMIPNVPCLVEKMKTDGPGGQYVAPLKSGDAGRFYVNLVQYKNRATFGMMALTLHEVSPGHHCQSFVQLNASSLPEFRRYTDYSKYYCAPYHFPFFTAYAEGWALYAESLGEEIGAYDTPYDRFGLYSSEIVRAARLVVDTGIHAFNWSREQAVDYMTSTAFTVKERMENEVDRYITWPGQACAYKIGELKIKELRQSAEKTLGDGFNIKEFHRQVLQIGAVPLMTLESHINCWIESKCAL